MKGRPRIKERPIGLVRDRGLEVRAQGRGVLKMKGREAQREEKRPRARRKEEEAVRKGLKEGP
jgi:hypothetical protein